MGYEMEFEIREDFIIARAKGSASLEGNIEFARKLIDTSMKNERKRILIDIRDLADPTSIFDAHKLSDVGAALVKGKSLKIALLHGEERKELESFFETTSRSRGVNIRVLMDEERSMEWLLG